MIGSRLVQSNPTDSNDRMATNLPRNNVARIAASAVLVALMFVLIVWPLAMVFHAAWEARGVAEPGRTGELQSTSLATSKGAKKDIGKSVRTPERRRASLGANTAALVLLTLSIALPLGVASALAVFRTDTPGRSILSLLILLPALLPVDLHATAWLATLGPQGVVLAIGLPIELKGLVGAAWIHAMASIPWVVAVVGVAVSVVEAELEEDCLLLVGPIRTMWHVTLGRSIGAVVAAALIVAVLAAGEMAVTDLLQVRTYAETIYTEFAIAARVGAATATAVPGLAVWLVLVAVAGWLVVQRVPLDAQALFTRRPVFRLGSLRWMAMGFCAVVLAGTLVIPAASLVWRTGLKYATRAPSAEKTNSLTSTAESSAALATDSTSPHWSAAAFAENLVRSARSARDQVKLSLVVAAATAIVTVPLALLLALIARHGRVGRWLVAGTACLLFAMPGPVLGIGLTLALGRPTAWWGTSADSVGGQVALGCRSVADSPAVLVWLHSLRTLPFALAVIWPVLRLVNRSLVEAAAIDGAGAWSRFWHVDLPACRGAVLAAGLACAVLSIGELSGSVIVTPPGLQPLSVRIFSFAHFGLESHLAGICLVLLGVAGVGSLAVLLSLRWTVRSLRK
jgi:iron(III) transport system permease protein